VAEHTEPPLPEQDPACPACGCGEVQVLRPPIPGEWFGQGKARCTHCGRVYAFAAPAEGQPVEQPVYRVVRPRLRCPRCRSIDVRTHTTRPEKDTSGLAVPEGSVLRYHKCSRCDYDFSSLER
jgi:hypothetical protein